MAGLQKRDTSLAFDIFGELFTVHPFSWAFTQKRIDLAVVAQDGQKNLLASGNNAETVKETMVALSSVVDGLLCEGAVKRIFKEEDLDLVLLIDIVLYIFDELEKFDHVHGDKLKDMNKSKPSAEPLKNKRKAK